MKLPPFSSWQHLPTQKSPFVGTGGPLLCPPFMILLNLVPRLNAIMEVKTMGILHVVLSPRGSVPRKNSVSLGCLLLVPEYCPPQGPPVQQRSCLWRTAGELV